MSASSKVERAAERESWSSTAPIESHEWSDPEPLPDDLPAVMPFDDELLPSTFRPWIVDIAERLQCPPDFPAVAAMIPLGVIVGRKVGIRPKRQDDWLVVPNLWGAVIGRPSVMKSPAIREPLKVLGWLEVEGRDNFQAAQLDYEARLAVHAARKTALGRKLARGARRTLRMPLIGLEGVGRKSTEIGFRERGIREVQGWRRAWLGKRN